MPSNVSASLELVGVCFAHSDAVPLLTDVDLRLSAGRTGIVGPNGSGKTTLLRLLCGALAPDGGAVRRHPAGLRVALCEQEVEPLAAGARELAGRGDGAARRLRDAMHLDPRQLDRWPRLSPGERKRWQVSAALAGEPGALLLDEPTNHLDAQALEWLIPALRRFAGVGVIVSHDRSLLDRLTTRTVRFEHGRVTEHRGSYETARAGWEAARGQERDAHAKLQRERRTQRRRLADKRRARAAAERATSTRRNMKSARDSDARGRFKAKRRRSAEVSLGRDIQLTRRRIERIDGALSAYRFEKTPGRSLFVDWEPAPVSPILRLETPRLERGGRLLARDVQVAVRRESRVHLTGRNGAGKTTLLRELMARARIPAPRILHLPQELPEAAAAELLRDARSLEPDARGRLMNLVAALGVDPQALLQSQRISPGEARKLALAAGLARRAWVLLLDEPTNHLDLPSIERLESALRAYPGALVVVSHDRTFAERTTDTVWELSGERLAVRAAPAPR